MLTRYGFFRFVLRNPAWTTHRPKPPRSKRQWSFSTISRVSTTPDSKAIFGVKKRDLLYRFRPFRDGTPTHDHLGGILAVLDAEPSKAASPPASALCSVRSKVTKRSNEIIAIPELLELTTIEGVIATIDAMGYQREIAQKAIDKKADYTWP